MSCKYATVQTENNDVSGSDIEQSIHCEIKMASEESMLQVYAILFEMGLEDSLVSTICPFAIREEWHVCPYRELK
jgi:hypothetical protein